MTALDRPLAAVTAITPVLTGTSGADILSGGAADERFTATEGNDVIDGGAGRDSVRYAGALASFTVDTGAGGALFVTKPATEGADTLLHIERLLFDDGALAFDAAGTGGQAYRIYQAAFDRVPDAAGLGYWISQMEHGATLATVAAGFVGSAEFSALYGAAPSNGDILQKFYQNVLHRAPDAAGYAYWLDLLDTHRITAANTLAQFSESAENQAALVDVIGKGVEYLPFG